MVSSRNAWRPQPPFCILNKKKNSLQIMSLAAYASETINNSSPVKQEISYFTVTSVSNQVLLFALIIFYLWLPKC